MAFLSAHDLFGVPNSGYYSTAKSVFDFVYSQAWSTDTCSGGLWWSSKKNYKNAITNELALYNAVHLYQAGAGKDYLAKAFRIWNWFNQSGMINPRGLVNDGLQVVGKNASVCKNNGQSTWTYNQGVLVGALVRLSDATNRSDFVKVAVTIADATLTQLVTKDGILSEVCGSSCNEDGVTFKGIFVRNLRALIDNPFLDAATKTRYCTFLNHNARSAVAHARTAAGLYGGLWQGPVTNQSSPVPQTDNIGAAPQTSAVELLVAAASCP